jgi:2-oxoglutarate ferredoxin oxidoreductase subunit delta
MPKENSKKARGRVFVVPEWCKGCRFCIEFCPMKVLEQSTGFNSKGYHPPIVVSQDKCTGCNLCGMLCPDFCIWATKDEI